MATVDRICSPTATCSTRPIPCYLSRLSQLGMAETRRKRHLEAQTRRIPPSPAVRMTSSEIDEIAAAWALRAQEGPLSPERDAELQRWLDSDSRHLGAYTRAMGALAYFDRAKALKAAPSTRDVARMPTAARRRLLQVLGAAAGFGGVAVAGSWIWGAVSARTSTRKGEVRVMPLADGSEVTLDTESTVQTAFGPGHRTVRLLAGKALFDVAKDETRPFNVLAGGVNVRAVGTSFSVQLLARDQVRVLVREGKVEVTRAAPLGTARQAPLLLSANMSTLAADLPRMTAIAETSETVDRQLAWRSGMLDFDGESLEQVAAQFARYSDYALQVDPDVANTRISGRFMAADARGFAKAAGESLGLTADLGPRSASLHR